MTWGIDVLIVFARLLAQYFLTKRIILLALRPRLKDLDLTYMVKDEVLQITTPEIADNSLTTKVYPVGDLVLPISGGANANPFMMGGGMGGGGGFGGGMGGGMGGMGGGGIGGMGGFMAVGAR